MSIVHSKQFNELISLFEYHNFLCDIKYSPIEVEEPGVIVVDKVTSFSDLLDLTQPTNHLPFVPLFKDFTRIHEYDRFLKLFDVSFIYKAKIGYSQKDIMVSNLVRLIEVLNRKFNAGLDPLTIPGKIVKYWERYEPFRLVISLPNTISEDKLIFSISKFVYSVNITYFSNEWHMDYFCSLDGTVNYTDNRSSDSDRREYSIKQDSRLDHRLESSSHKHIDPTR